MTRILITGGAGFLGRAVAGTLAAREDVECVISGDLRVPDAGRPGITDVVCDVTDPDAVEPILREHAIDVVVHLAAIVDQGHDVDREYRVDVTGSDHVLRACQRAGVRRLVVSSSGAAYGYHPDNAQWLVESDPVRGNDEFPYSRHKRLVEEMLAESRETHPELEQVVFRIGTILGPTVANQITKLWDGRRILAVAGSDSPFVFVWVDDVARAMARAATDGPAGIFNVAGDGALTVRQIADRLGKKVLVVPAPLLAGGLWLAKRLGLTPHGPAQVRFLRYRPVLANAALKSDFGYTPQYTSREAFEEYLATHPGVAR